MKKLIVSFFVILISLSVFAQSKVDYLQQNRFDLRDTDFQFPQQDFNIIGFGAYHGSAKTYDAEYALIKSLKKQNLIDYYVIETNFSQAFFFQQYLNTGDEKLLKDLVFGFQTIVSQEGTVETFNHWKRLRDLNQTSNSTKIQVLGFDIINEYKFPIKHIVYLTDAIQQWESRDKLKTQLKDDNVDFSVRNKALSQMVSDFISDYTTNKDTYSSKVSDTISMNHIIKNLKYIQAEKVEREKVIYDNYLDLKDLYQLATKKQFAKYGFFHINKEREYNYPSFFTRLIEGNIFDRDKVITIIGYFNNSEVLWNKVYDDNGVYQKFTIEKGYGIGDYWKEYFKGIRNLKKTKVSDLTLFKLNNTDSPYGKGTDLIEVKLFMKKSNGKALKGKPTTRFVDYAVLIDDSRNQTPIEEMK